MAQHQQGSVQAETTAPERGSYRFVLRRRDRISSFGWRVHVSYAHPSHQSRDITFRGVRAPTLFLRNEAERRAAYRIGWREDITAKWFEDLALIESGKRPTKDIPSEAKAKPGPVQAVVNAVGAVASAAAGVGLDVLEGMAFAELRALAKEHGLSAAGSANDLRARIRQHRA